MIHLKTGLRLVQNSPRWNCQAGASARQALPVPWENAGDQAARSYIDVRYLVHKRILAVATDVADVSRVTGRIAGCGLTILGAVEAMSALPILNSRYDVMVIHVRQGRELRAYYASLAARLHRISVVLIIPDIRTTAVNALIYALPWCEHLMHSDSDFELMTRISIAFEHDIDLLRDADRS